MDEIVGHVELGRAAAGQEMAVARRPVEGPDRGSDARLARRPTLLVPQHERLDDRGPPLQGGRPGLGIVQVDALPTTGGHLVLGPGVARHPGRLQGERVGVRAGGGQVEGEP